MQSNYYPTIGIEWCSPSWSNIAPQLRFLFHSLPLCGCGAWLHIPIQCKLVAHQKNTGPNTSANSLGSCVFSCFIVHPSNKNNSPKQGFFSKNVTKIDLRCIKNSAMEAPDLPSVFRTDLGVGVQELTSSHSMDIMARLHNGSLSHWPGWASNPVRSKTLTMPEGFVNNNFHLVSFLNLNRKNIWWISQFQNRTAEHQVCPIAQASPSGTPSSICSSPCRSLALGTQRCCEKPVLWRCFPGTALPVHCISKDSCMPIWTWLQAHQTRTVGIFN